MGAFLDWFFAFLSVMAEGLWKIVSGLFGGIFQIFNIVGYVKQFNKYKDGFSVVDWIFSIISFLLVLAIWAILIYMLVLLIRKYIRFRKSAVGNEDLLEEVAKLHSDVLRLTKEKERILALKIGETSVSVEELNDIFKDEEERAVEEEAFEDTEEEDTKKETNKKETNKKETSKKETNKKETSDDSDVEETDKKDFISRLNPESLKVMKGYAEKVIAEAETGTCFQFLRTGYFCKDPDSTAEKPVFNRTVGLRDTFAKQVKA